MSGHEGAMAPKEQIAQSARLEEEIRENLARLGYGG